MKPLVYVIGHTMDYIIKVQEILSNQCVIEHVKKSELIGKIYTKQPNSIIIIEDDIDEAGVYLIDSTISLEYIPIVSISFSKEAWQVNQILMDAVYMDSRHMAVALPLLVAQAKGFTNRYHSMHVAQDAFDVMNEGIRKSLDDFIEADKGIAEKVLERHLKEIYVENFLAENTPSYLWIIRKKNDGNFMAILIPVKGDCLLKEFEFEDETLDFEPFKETGFFKNVHNEELSDIDDAEKLIPDALLDYSDEISNVANYAMDDTLVVAINYINTIEQTDLNILKALTIQLDLMVTIRDKVSELEDSFDYTLNALARAAEGKDDVTGQHIRRVNYYSRVIARALSMDEKFVKNITIAAQMHDVGKIFIPESVLNKPGRLTDEEFELMKTHAANGQVIIGEREELRMAASIARHHHERYDGNGYPDRLKGEEIPIEARIVFLADIYDALRSPRPYKDGFSHEKAYDIIVNGDGRVEPAHFDPSILAVFKDQHPVFREIYEVYKDE